MASNLSSISIDSKGVVTGRDMLTPSENLLRGSGPDLGIGDDILPPE
jgi:hypothetical protein